MKSLLYRIEALVAFLFFTAFRLLPLDLSSWLGGVIGRVVGPFFSAHKTARKNIKAAFPQLTPLQQLKLLRGMWEHLGRVAAEFSSLPGTRLTSRVTMSGAEHLPQPGQAVIFFSGHIGNWELSYPMAFDHSVPTTIVYRHINNPYIETMVADIRRTHATTLIQKGIRGAVHLLKSVKRGESLAMLVDQKMNSGISVPFFGREAMTSTAAAELSLKYGLPIIPARIIRTRGAHFEGIIYPPLQYTKTGDHQADVRAIMLAINQLLEGWIREYPEQWFWVHQRWPKDS